MAFSNSAVIQYPIDKVFSVFIRTAKRDFPKFNENNPVGCKVKKRVGAYSAQTATLEIEITEYKKNEIYQIVSRSNKQEYYSTYNFELVDENSTRITLVEEDTSGGFFPFLNNFVQNLLFKKRVRTRFAYFIEGLEREIDQYDEKLKKNSKSKADEKAKIEEREAKRKAKEEALKAEEEAKKAEEAVKKAIKEAEEAKRKAEEATAKAESI